MSTRAALERQIQQENARHQSYPRADLLTCILNGSAHDALTDLIFFTDPWEFGALVDNLAAEISAHFAAAPQVVQERALLFLADLAKWLHSYLPHWNLTRGNHQGGKAISASEVDRMAGRLHRLAVELAHLAPPVEQVLLANWRREAAMRFGAEAANDPQREANLLVGGSLEEYLTNFGAAITRSNLRRIAEMRAAGQNRTEISNDYAAFLRYAMFLGASFATCNPALVDIAWITDPDTWNPVVDDLARGCPADRPDDLARRVTLEIVLANMRLLRPIFLLTSGGMGCVCLQVNPHRHGDYEAMMSDALFYWEELGKRVGGVPNVVFKLPGTLAGLRACRALTRQGIGVTITVNFGMFQHIPFAEAIHEGQAIFSTLVTMSGRLAFPVRDELLGKLERLRAHGIDEARARVAAAWSGVAVLKRLQALLVQQGYDLNRIKPLTASHRIYDGEIHGGLANPLVDITEVLGTRLITVFPNIRRAFDSLGDLVLNPTQIERPVPEQVMSTLAHSEIFRQAYFVGDRHWLAGEDRRFIPEKVLTLEDEDSTSSWTPVRNTLNEFCDRYDRFVQRIQGRRRLIALRAQALAGERASGLDEALVRSALTHFDGPTVREALCLLGDLPPQPALRSILGTDEIREAIAALGDAQAQEAYRRAAVRHEL